MQHTSLRTLVNAYRIDAAKKLLLEKENISILQAAFQCGFNSKNAFNTAFNKQGGMTPTEFREKNKKHVMVYKPGRRICILSTIIPS